MKQLSSLIVILFFVCGLIPLAGWAQQAGGRDRSESVRVALRDQVSMREERLRIGDVVDLSGGTSTMRAKISQLELALNDKADEKLVSKSDVLARILLAGVQPDQFDITGADEVHIGVVNSKQIEQAIKHSIVKHISSGLNIDENDVNISLSLNQNQVDAFAFIGQTRFVLRPFDHADRILGRRLVELGVFDGNSLVSEVSVLCTVAVFQPSLKTRRPIEAGETLDETNCYFDQQLVTSINPKFLTEYPKPGEITSKRMRAQQVVTDSDITNTAERVDFQKPVIKARDIVNVVADKGGLKITLVGAEAMRAGKVGDVIPLRNPNSKETIYGRIESRDVVKLVY